MGRISIAGLVTSLGLLAGLTGCSSSCCPPKSCHTSCPPPCAPRPSAGTVPQDPWRAAAVRYGRGRQAIWSFLSTKYDVDHDGKIAATEYPRDAKVFGRLDEDGDGALTAADFSGPTRMDTYLAGFVLMRLALREDPPAPPSDKTVADATPSDDDLPSAASVEKAFARADANRDRRVDERELVAALAQAEAIPVKGAFNLPAGVRPFPFLLAAMDADKSGTLTLAEEQIWLAKEKTEREEEEKKALKEMAERKKVAEEAAKKKEAEEAAKALAASAADGAPTQPATEPADGSATPTSAAPTAAPTVAATPPPKTAPTPPPSGRRPAAPGLGTMAPDFALRTRNGTETTALSSFRGKRPVALIFGSYTCPPFRESGKWIRQAYDRYGKDVEFIFVYIREAHAVDGGAPMPAEDQPLVENPRTFEERRSVAQACALDLKFGPFRTLVDGIDDAAAKAYVAPPVRLYVLDREGRIAYRSAPGPFGLEGPAFDAAVSKVARGESAPPPVPPAEPTGSAPPAPASVPPTKQP